VSYAVYVYNRLLEVGADEATNPERTAYVAGHRRALWRAFFLSSVLAAVIMVTTASLSGALFLGVVYVCGLLYTNTFKALTRFIAGFKTFYVATAFTALVFLPFLYAKQQIPFGTLVPFAGWVFLNAAIMQMLLDVKDIASDGPAGLRTIPLLLGRKATFRALYVLTILAAIPPLLWETGASHFPARSTLLALAPLFSLFSIRIAEKGAYRGYLLESGKFICWPVLLALGRALRM
jgi:4-hydroxybenzoate polyprenyltransferase